MAKRIEYPRPQFVRESWQNLNGTWQFAFDDGNVGLADRWFDTGRELQGRIEVPFAYQSSLSGIHDPSFHDWVWYKRNFRVDEAWKNKRVWLRFGAVDYRAWVYVNGKYVGTHEGGHTPFGFDITEELTWQEEQIAVRVEDPSTDETIPRGKQFWVEQSAGIWYTRTTGIWQTVWLEPVDPVHLETVRFHPDIDRGDISIELEFAGPAAGAELGIEIAFQGRTAARDRIVILDRYARRSINLFGREIFRTGYHQPGWTWTPEHPNLFEVTFTLRKDGRTLDEVRSYFGMRKVRQENGMVFLNNKPYYQRLILDQGYWPEGLLTAPSDDDLRRDIELAKAMGFNGCRKHQKVEDPRFLYWADKLGFIVWGECASSPSYSNGAAARLTKEWIEIVERDYNHPSILVWVPLNESWGVPNIRGDSRQQHHSLALYSLIHSLDPTRLVISNDGWEMTRTDICAVHNYNHGLPEETEKYAEFKRALATKDGILQSQPSLRALYADGFGHLGEPILLTEFGGIAYKAGAESGWGYTSVSTSEELVREYRRVLEAVYESRVLNGFCYTQLTDVEQEINGLLTYDRKPKCDPEEIRKINLMRHSPVIRE
ncbi:glycoside hydrolase family 2 protein [Cohnella caldifontis]|uniref:glycoside hydrolase family 2 protein n=1 Tax=Cohnella caldifontis TaxID=3027471 RepID=UPI0023ECF820|nr:sugar-binding domain-containing protein [Cohnella sp. YIM B05605]